MPCLARKSSNVRVPVRVRIFAMRGSYRAWNLSWMRTAFFCISSLLKPAAIKKSFTGIVNISRYVFMLIGLWPNSWNSSLSSATVAAASAISTPFQSKTTSLIILFKIFDCVPEYLQPWPFLRHRLAFPNVRFAKVRPMRHLREAHSTLGMRHESQDATIVRSDTCDVFQRPVGIGWHLGMFCRFP